MHALLVHLRAPNAAETFTRRFRWTVRGCNPTWNVSNVCSPSHSLGLFAICEDAGFEACGE